MYKAFIKYEITSGILKGIIATDTYTCSSKRDNRVVGGTYKSFTHYYRIMEMSYEKIK